MKLYLIFISFFLSMSVLGQVQDNLRVEEQRDTISLELEKKRMFDLLEKSIDEVDPELDIIMRELEEGVEVEEVEPVFELIEQMPSFPGGDDAMLKFIADSLRYPINAYNMGIQGLVVVRVVVDPEGQLSNPTVIKRLDASCDREAIRLIESMPRWVPGWQGDVRVSVYHVIPVLFRINE